jgi:regulator of CtrA degradation
VQSEDESLNGLTPQDFIGSAMFEKTFEEGMSLVEETAKYLDGKGREESREMQAASWLLVQRAVHDGDMDAEDAAGDRYRLGSKEICLGGGADGTDQLPTKLQDLLQRSDSIYRRIARLDDVLFRGGASAPGVQAHFDKLERAFGA